MRFELHAQHTGVVHPYISFHNPTTAMQQICKHTVEKTTVGVHAGAKYVFATGAHGCGMRIDITTGIYTGFLNELKRNLSLLCPEGKPRDLVVHYGRSSNAQATCEDITTYLEGHYRHDRETREITFFPKDGDDALYVMELVSQHKDLMCLRRKEARIDPISVKEHAATGVFIDLERFTGVSCVTDEDGGVRFLARSHDQWEAISSALMSYKIAYVMDKW
uniref:Uncharacterized protein n=1 Tax=Pseudomonas phage RVTF4 TaxID=3236931 RepID=A0AB39CCK3_9VIRU